MNVFRRRAGIRLAFASRGPISGSTDRYFYPPWRVSRLREDSAYVIFKRDLSYDTNSTCVIALRENAFLSFLFSFWEPRQLFTDRRVLSVHIYLTLSSRVLYEEKVLGEVEKLRLTFLHIGVLIEKLQDCSLNNIVEISAEGSPVSKRTASIFLLRRKRFYSNEFLLKLE